MVAATQELFQKKKESSQDPVKIFESAPKKAYFRGK